MLGLISRLHKRINRLRRRIWPTYYLLRGFHYEFLVRSEAIITNQEKLMTTAEEIKAAVNQVLSDVDAATNRVAVLIDGLSNQIKNSMTDAEVAEIKTGLAAASERSRAIAADPVTPIPPEPQPLQAAFKSAKV
jgi:predicted  nucleic acid-binding Zn-ribbon protein